MSLKSLGGCLLGYFYKRFQKGVNMTRSCLKCKQNFISEGNYNRICTHCKQLRKQNKIDDVFLSKQVSSRDISYAIKNC